MAGEKNVEGMSGGTKVCAWRQRVRDGHGEAATAPQKTRRVLDIPWGVGGITNILKLQGRQGPVFCSIGEKTGVHCPHLSPWLLPLGPGGLSRVRCPLLPCVTERTEDTCAPRLLCPVIENS